MKTILLLVILISNNIISFSQELQTSISTKKDSITIGVYTPHPSTINSVDFSKDGNFILTGGGKTIKIWDTKTGKPLYTLKGHQERINDAKFYSDSKYIISCAHGRHKNIIRWDFKNEKAIATQNFSFARDINISDKEQLAYLTNTWNTIGVVNLHSINNNYVEELYTDYSGYICSDISKDSKYLCLVSNNYNQKHEHTISIFNTQEKALVWHKTIKQYVYQIMFSQNDSSITLRTENKIIHYKWQKNKKTTLFFSRKLGLNSFDISENGQELIFVNNDSTIFFFRHKH